MSTGEPDYYHFTESSQIKLVVGEGRGAFVFKGDAQAKAVRDALCERFGPPEGCATIAKEPKVAIDPEEFLRLQRENAMLKLMLEKARLIAMVAQASRALATASEALDGGEA